MNYAGTALEDIAAIRQAFPRDFTHSEVMDHFGWGKARARQAIVMGVSKDYFRIVGAEDATTQWVTYENVEWRKHWITSDWGVSHEWRKLAG
jgi:hypothetical protein